MYLCLYSNLFIRTTRQLQEYTSTEIYGLKRSKLDGYFTICICSKHMIMMNLLWVFCYHLMHINF